MGIAAFSKPACAVLDKGYTALSAAGGYNPKVAVGTICRVPARAQRKPTMGDCHCTAQAHKRSVAARPILAALMLFAMATLAAAQTDLRHGNSATAALDPKVIRVLKKVAAHVLSNVRPLEWDTWSRNLEAQNIADYKLLAWGSGKYNFMLTHFSPYGQPNNFGNEEIHVELALYNPGICPPRPEQLPAHGLLTTERSVIPMGFPLGGRPHEKTNIELVYAKHIVRIFYDITFAPPGATEERALRLARIVHDGMVAEGNGMPCGAAPSTSGAPSKEGVPNTEGTPWKLVVGLGAAAALAIGAVVKIMAAKAAAAKAVAATAARKTAGKKVEKEDPDRSIGYILQLSANQFTLKAGAPANAAYYLQ
jgi:hypothetical protein